MEPARAIPLLAPYGGGINGITQNSTLNIKSDALVEEMAATNRGFVVNGSVAIDGTIENLSTGLLWAALAATAPMPVASPGNSTIKSPLTVQLQMSSYPSLAKKRWRRICSGSW